MSEHRRPTPLIAEANTTTCPVCGKTSYSLGGTHPQCAMRHGDAQRQEKLRTKKESPAKPPQRRSWTKKCPKYGVEVHLRKKACDCGHDFFSR
jgi:hypothetical protein